MKTISVLLDTDIGSDIDDAVALAYLLRQPACELVGITTVTGEPQLRASLADAICRAAGRDDIPIHVGCAEPLLIEQRQKGAAQAEALTADYPHRLFRAENSAVEFLRQTIRSRPGELTLLPIGPLTNIALLFALDPEIPQLLKGITLMGGCFFSDAEKPPCEWNILCDPHAAARVFAAPVEITAIGLDVTLQVTLPAELCRTRFTSAGGSLGVVGAMAEVWFRHTPRLTFHDPLAVAVLFEPELCTYERGGVAVDITTPGRMGLTSAAVGAGSHRLARTVDANAFFQHYFGEVFGLPLDDAQEVKA